MNPRDLPGPVLVEDPREDLIECRGSAFCHAIITRREWYCPDCMTLASEPMW